MRVSILVAVLLLSFPACSSGDAGLAAQVSMTSDHAFDPTSLTVAPGTKVTWTNDDDEPHTVTAYADGVPPGGFFSSGDPPDEQAARESVSVALIQPGDAYSFTFAEAGTYEYFCIPHEDHGMTGEIVVEE